MKSHTATHERTERWFSHMGVRSALLALAFMFAHVSHALPIMVDVYGAPYFSLSGAEGIRHTDRQWVVFGAPQRLSVSMTNGQLDLHGKHDLAASDRSGNARQFSLTAMSLILPESDATDFGTVDYEIDNAAGQFIVERVVYRSLNGNDESGLSLFFWGIDHANGVGMVLGLQSVSPINGYTALEPVSEPPMALLLLLGLTGLLFSGRVRRRVPAGS